MPKQAKARRRGCRCPACHTLLTKTYRRSLSPLEWEKLQSSHWMTAWNREYHRNVELSRRLAEAERQLKQRRRKKRA